MNNNVPCDVCSRIDRRQVRGVCVECWPQQRAMDAAFDSGRRAAKKGEVEGNPFSPEREYDQWISWEIGWDSGRPSEDQDRLLVRQSTTQGGGA